PPPRLPALARQRRSRQRTARESTLRGASRARLLPQAQSKLAPLLVVDRARRLGQQALTALSFRKRDHIADRLGARHQRHDAVEPERDSAVRRRTEPQVVQQEAELRARLVLGNAERAEHLLLDVGAMDADRSAADLPAVEHYVVALGERACGVRRQQVLGPVLWRGTRMVQRALAA